MNNKVCLSLKQNLRVIRTIGLSLVFLALVSGCADEEDSMDSGLFVGEPWYTIEDTKRLDASGNPMVACRRPEFEPIELMEAAEMQGVSYSIGKKPGQPRFLRLNARRPTLREGQISQRGRWG